jgi:hypothetical protein
MVTPKLFSTIEVIKLVYSFSGALYYTLMSALTIYLTILEGQAWHYDNAFNDITINNFLHNDKTYNT